MSPIDAIRPAAKTHSLAALPLVTTPARPLNDRLWALLTRPGPLTADEWAYIDEQERAGACD